MKPIKTLIQSAAAIGIAGIGYYTLAPLPAEFQDQPHPAANCPTRIFDKSADVFGAVTICATRGVPVEKLEHAASVTAQWLDNDQDGKADEASVIENLTQNKATMVMSAEGLGRASGKVFSALEADGRFGQDLHAVETANPSRRDASQEETHHLVIGAGWAAAYPEIFSDQSESSAVYQAWETADAEKYYQYDDPTCDSNCKVMEFVYKSTAAYLGAESDLQNDEFTIKSQAELMEKLPRIAEIYESTDYSYPRSFWPDGEYPHKDRISYR